MRQARYYDGTDTAHDGLMRCKDCRQLVLAATLRTSGSCPCGCRRVVEITILSDEERDRIVSGSLDFPHKDKFLEEFSPLV